MSGKNGKDKLPPLIMSNVVNLVKTISVWNTVKPIKSTDPGKINKDVNPHKKYMK